MPVDARVQNFTEITNEPTSDDSLVVVNRNNNAGQIIDYNLLADKILAKLTSKTYSGLDTNSKSLVGAINELDSDVGSLSSSVSTASARVQHGYSLTTTGSGITSTTCEALFTQLISLVGSGTGVTSVTANISGQVYGGVALIASTAYGAFIFFNYGGTLRLCSRNNSTTWTIKSVTFA